VNGLSRFLHAARVTLEPLLGPCARVDELGGAEAVPDALRPKLVPELLDSLREIGELGRRLGICSFGKPVPQLGASRDRLVQLASDLGGCTHNLFNEAAGGPIPCQAGERTRTSSRRLTKALLCQLSYTGTVQS
jgi:hypothetical protein